jgi:hemerythrin superfamily protein
MANAIELIKSDHRTVEQLFQRYRSLNGQTRQKQSIIQEVCHELTLHAQLEEEIFYPAVERKLGSDGATLVKEAHHRPSCRCVSLPARSARKSLRP